MNITRENIDDLNAVLRITLVKDDYEERVKNVLKDYRRKAHIDGFRPGKVPYGMIDKMYRKPVLIEEINKLVSESVSKYLAEEKVNILGEPLPNREKTTNIDWENDAEFEFSFDLGLAPEFDIAITPKDKFVRYQIKTDKELLEKYIDSYASRYGAFKSAEYIEDKEYVKAEIAELDNEGNELADGVKVEEASLSMDMVKDDKIKATFIGRKKGDSFTVNLKKAFPNETDLAAMLKLDKSRLEDLSDNFSITVREVSIYEKAEVNQELFDKVYGEGKIKSREEFEAKVEEEAAKALEHDSEYKLQLDIKEYYLKKFKKELPVEFLKRWIKITNEKVTEEQIENEFPQFEKDLKWQLIKDKMLKDNDIQIDENDLKEGAKEIALMQFRQYYGMMNVPDEHLEAYAVRILENEEEKRRIAERKLEEKIIVLIKNTTKLETKAISSEKFNKLMEK